MVRKRRPRPRRMSSILEGLGGSDCFATQEDWQEYQYLLQMLKMRALEQVDEIRAAQGFRHQPAKRKNVLAARVER